MNVLVLGKGFISDHLPFPKYTKTIVPDFDFIQSSVIDKHKPDVIINCIGRTGSPNVDWCEEHKAETAYANVQIPIALADATRKSGVRLLHLGSGCIFYGQSPSHEKVRHEKVENLSWGAMTRYVYLDSGWKETDHANPKSFYSKTKYAADLVLAPQDHTTILRLRMPISSSPHPRNLLTKLVGYKRILEEPNSVTFMHDLVRAIDWTIKNQKTGIYNVVSSLPITHSMLLEEYRKYVPTHTYERISDRELSTMVVAARSNCILDNRKIISEGFEFTPTLASIQKCVGNFVKV
jgi:dTDP-4-dehydrorhamnose reductase